MLSHPLLPPDAKAPHAQITVAFDYQQQRAPQVIQQLTGPLFNCFRSLEGFASNAASIVEAAWLAGTKFGDSRIEPLIAGLRGKLPQRSDFSSAPRQRAAVYLRPSTVLPGYGGLLEALGNVEVAPQCGNIKFVFFRQQVPAVNGGRESFVMHLDLGPMAEGRTDADYLMRTASAVRTLLQEPDEPGNFERSLTVGSGKVKLSCCWAAHIPGEI